MASTKMQKPVQGTGSHPHEDHKFGQKISEMTSKVFGHKQQENQATAKHCNTCKCPTPQKKEDATTVLSVKDSRTNGSKAHKDGKQHHTNCIELKKDKQHVVFTPTKESRQTHSTEKKEQHSLINKEQKGKAGNNYFSSMTDHLKEKIMMMKKTKDGKSKDSSSSDSEDEAPGKQKRKNKVHIQETKHVSK